MHFRSARTSILSLSLLAAMALPAAAQVTLKNAFPNLTFNRPVYIGQLPGADRKTFVVLEQHIGVAALVFQKDNAWVKDTLIKINVNQANEMGLLGIAFHPDFENNRKYYVSYNPPGTAFADIVEERETDATLMQDAGKARILVNISDKHNNHNGGTIGFGPKDGLLYIGTGDGGSSNDPDGNGQNKNVLLGKILRIDVDKKDAGLEYGIPPANPFAQGGGRGEVYAYGLRNPWKWSFDALTGTLWAGDVGQFAIEEVDTITSGGNYGWKLMEGPVGTNSGNMILPVFSYGRDTGTAVIGGIVYRGNPASKYYGTYFFSDESGRRIMTLKLNASGPPTFARFATAPDDPISLGTDGDGLIYLGTKSAVSPVYLLDSPDLGPSTTALGRRAPEARLERTFTVKAGSRLPEAAFGGASALRIRSMEGAALGSVSRKQGRLPAGIRSGLYVLEAEGAQPSRLLVP